MIPDPVLDGAAPRVPGEPGIWVVVLGDLFVFALLFGTVAYYRLDDPPLFHAAQASMNQTLGLINTLALLTSSLFVAQGLQAVRDGRVPAARGWIGGAGALGLLFVIVKAIEYSQKGAEGFYPDTNIFFTLYYVLTGIHLIHVLVGLTGLMLMWRGATHVSTPAQTKLMECGGVFWHLVDVLWVFLFAIFYLHR